MGHSNPNTLGYLTPFLIITLLTTHCISSTPGSHGQFCNGTTQPCATSALLICQDFICSCILPDSMTFVSSKTSNDPQGQDEGHCVSLVDEPCGLMSLEVDTPEEIALECVSNAYCNSLGECQCYPNYFKSDEGFCVSQRGFGEECSNSQECSKSLGLSCVGQRCQCDSTVSIDSLKFFDETEDELENRIKVDLRRPGHRCLGRPGKACLGDGHHCVPNAVCKEEHVMAGDVMKMQHICACEPGFEESKKKKVCVGSYNKTCDTQSNRFCGKGLSCMKGRCECKNPSDQIYDKESQTCLSLIGGPCANSGGCVTNAICKRLGENGVVPSSAYNQLGKEVEEVEGSASLTYEYCECDEGFVENMNRTCDVGYGHPCSQTLEGWKCDTLSGLTCRDGFCACPNPGQMYDKESMKCRSLAGSFCYRHIKDNCIKNAHCKSHRNGFLPFGHCECNEDHTFQGDRTCHCENCA